MMMVQAEIDRLRDDVAAIDRAAKEREGLLVHRDHNAVREGDAAQIRINNRALNIARELVRRAG